MRTFHMVRDVDHSDFSGTGTVMEGVEFDDGRVALQWLGHYPSIVIWPSIAMAETVHGHGGDTVVKWLDGNTGPRLFELHRFRDVSGVSGEGLVAQGAQFDTGACVLRWLGTLASTAVYDSVTDLIAVHGHNGATELIWDEAPALSAAA